MVVSVDDPKYWHDKALEVHAIERRASDPRIKRMLTEIAQRYDAIAKLTAERVVVPKPARRKWKRFCSPLTAAPCEQAQLRDMGAK